MFDSISPTYDLLNRLLSMGIDVYWRLSALKLAGDVAGKRVLDLCSGTGDLTRMFRGKGADVVSLDFSVAMLVNGISRGWIDNSAVSADASCLPFTDNSFDYETIAFGIRNIPDIENFIRESLRVLKPGGRLIILELTRPQVRIVRFFYNIYLGKLLPFVGGIISGKKEAYDYLSETIREFIPPPDLREMLLSNGYSKINIHKKTFGVATIFECLK